MGIYYDVDHTIKAKQDAKRIQKAKQEQAKEEAQKSRKQQIEAHDKRERGSIY